MPTSASTLSSAARSVSYAASSGVATKRMLCANAPQTSSLIGFVRLNSATAS